MSAATPLWIRLHAAASTVAIALLAVVALRPASPEHDELTVQRINVVEPDGTTRLVISNAARLPDAVIGGETLPREARAPGILAYNGLGEETGGWLFDSVEREDGVHAYSSLTFDQYRQDQTLQLVYSDEAGNRLVGLRIKDRPDIPAGEHRRRLDAALALPEGEARDAALAPLLAPDRLFIGKSGDRSALWLLDASGKPRIKLVVDGTGDPRLEFLDAAGHVIDRLPRAQGEAGHSTGS